MRKPHTCTSLRAFVQLKEHWRETIVASCPNCHAPLATNAKFCPECGEKLKVTLRCRSCETTLTPGAKFCPECGEKV